MSQSEDFGFHSNMGHWERFWAGERQDQSHTTKGPLVLMGASPGGSCWLGPERERGGLTSRAGVRILDMFIIKTVH